MRSNKQRRKGSFAALAALIVLLSGFEVAHTFEADAPLLMYQSDVPAPSPDVPGPFPVVPSPSPTPIAPDPIDDLAAGQRAYIDAVRAQIAQARVIFQPELEMVHGEAAEVEAFVTLDLETPIVEFLADAEEVPFSTGRRVRARLFESVHCGAHDCNFQINTTAWIYRQLGVRTAFVDFGEEHPDTVGWTWSVVPLRSGRFGLTLEVEGLIDVPGAGGALLEEETAFSEQFVAPIAVEVNPAEEMIQAHSDLSSYAIQVDGQQLGQTHSIVRGGRIEITASRSLLSIGSAPVEALLQLSADDESIVAISPVGPPEGRVLDGARTWSWEVLGTATGATRLLLTALGTAEIGADTAQYAQQTAIPLNVEPPLGETVINAGGSVVAWIWTFLIGAATIATGLELWLRKKEHVSGGESTPRTGDGLRLPRFLRRVQRAVRQWLTNSTASRPTESEGKREEAEHSVGHDLPGSSRRDDSDADTVVGDDS